MLLASKVSKTKFRYCCGISFLCFDKIIFIGSIELKLIAYFTIGIFAYSMPFISKLGIFSKICFAAKTIPFLALKIFFAINEKICLSSVRITD